MKIVHIFEKEVPLSYQDHTYPLLLKSINVDKSHQFLTLVSAIYWILSFMKSCLLTCSSSIGRQPGYLGLCEDLGLLALLQTGSEAGHDAVFSTNHLHNLLVTLYTHTLINNYSKQGQRVNIWKIKSATITAFKK